MNKELYFKIVKVLLVLTSIVAIIGVLSMSVSLPKHATRERKTIIPQIQVAPISGEIEEESDEISIGGSSEEGITPSISLNDMEEETDPDHKVEEEPKTRKEKFIKETKENWKVFYNMNEIE